MSFLDPIFKALGFETEEKPKKSKEKKIKANASYDLSDGKRKKKEQPPEIDGVKVLYPYDIEETRGALAFIKKEQPVVVDFSMCNDIIKCYTYLEGAVGALDGRVKEVSKNSFLILPEGVLLEGEEE